MCSEEQNSYENNAIESFCLLVVVEVDCYSLNGLATVVLELNI